MGIYSKGKARLNSPILKATTEAPSDAPASVDADTYAQVVERARTTVSDVHVPVQPLNLNVVDVGQLAAAVDTMKTLLDDTITGSVAARKAEDTAVSQQLQFLAVLAEIQTFLAELRDNEALKRRVLEKLDQELS